MIYIAGWLFNYVMLAASHIDRQRGRIYCALAVMSIGTMAILRGSVGTDTVSYHDISAALRAGESVKIEPLFALLMQGLQWFLADDVLVVRAVTVVAVLLLWIYVHRADEDEQYFLLAVFMPAFSYLYTMNALRIGLASILLLLATQQYRRSRTFNPGVGVLGVAGLLCHYSLTFSLCFMVAVLRPLSRKLMLGILLSAAMLVALIAVVSISYFPDRLATYISFTAPSRLSGLSVIIGVTILLYGVLVGELPRNLRIRLLGLSTGFSILFFGAVWVSYAGVRLLNLLDFAVPLSILCAYGSCSQKLDRPIKIALCVFGLASAAFMFRNFLNETSYSVAPFLPYRFIFQS